MQRRVMSKVADGRVYATLARGGQNLRDHAVHIVWRATVIDNACPEGEFAA